MFKINYIRSYLRALRDYFLNKEEIIKSFALPMKKIDGKKNKDIFVDRNDKQIEFDKNFIDRLRGIINKDVVVSAHWEDMYSIGDKKNFHKQLIKMSDENFERFKNERDILGGVNLRADNELKEVQDRFDETK